MGEEQTKSLAQKFSEVAASTLNPVLLMVMGYISNVLLMVYNQGTKNPVVVKVVRILSFAVNEFRVELSKAVIDSPTPYDDKLIEELYEVIDVVLATPDNVDG